MMQADLAREVTASEVEADSALPRGMTNPEGPSSDVSW